MDLLCNCRAVARHRARINNEHQGFCVREVVAVLVAYSWVAGDIDHSQRFVRLEGDDARVCLERCVRWQGLFERQLSRLLVPLGGIWAQLRTADRMAVLPPSEGPTNSTELPLPLDFRRASSVITTQR
jgi:hypothetical protein